MLQAIPPIPFPNITAAIYLKGRQPANAKVEACATPVTKPKGISMQNISQKERKRHRTGMSIKKKPRTK
jgi:hypothetical protein